MSKIYKIELGENRQNSVCQCCGKESARGHGFVYKNGDPYAVYYAAWSDQHEEKKISLAIAIGEWSDDSTNEDRTCFGVAATEDLSKSMINFGFINPDESPWPGTDLMGVMIDRNSSIQHPLSKEVMEICSEIAYCHPAISDYLGTGTP